MHLHEFLAEVHGVLDPFRYLEVGVQHGTSLRLAHGAAQAIGIDPAPLTTATGNQQIFALTSDEYFEFHDLDGPVDLAFIDGLHHYEQAMRDFLNIEEWTYRGSVVIFDDVLPRNDEEAARVQCPGDWTGDVWKVMHLILKHRPDLTVTLVDTQPTGTLIVYGFTEPYLDPNGNWVSAQPLIPESELLSMVDIAQVPDPVLKRTFAVSPEEALAELVLFKASQGSNWA